MRFMISAWWLLLAIPVSASAGYIFAAVIAAGRREENGGKKGKE